METERERPGGLDARLRRRLSSRPYPHPLSELLSPWTRRRSPREGRRCLPARTTANTLSSSPFYSGRENDSPVSERINSVQRLPDDVLRLIVLEVLKDQDSFSASAYPPDGIRGAHECSLQLATLALVSRRLQVSAGWPASVLRAGDGDDDDDAECEPKRVSLGLLSAWVLEEDGDKC